MIFIIFLRLFFIKLQGLGQAFDRLQPFALCILLQLQLLIAGFMSAYGPASSLLFALQLNVIRFHTFQ